MTLPMPAIPDHEACWNAILAKDSALDGRLFFAVITTGVFCRPSCPARRPRRENVRFYATPSEAQADGFRPCLRCHPASTGPDPDTARIHRLCDYIRRNCTTGEPLTLAHLSTHAGLSPFHLQRTFKSVIGVSPRQYAQRCRLDALKTQLRSSDSVTTAVYESGFASPSRVYEHSDSHLGMTPGQYRAGAPSVPISYVTLDTPLGPMMLAATTRGLCFLQFADSPGLLLDMLRTEFPGAILEHAPTPAAPPFAHWIDALSAHLNGARDRLDLPLDLRATSFQAKIWAHLQSIPAGATASYSQIAAATGNPRATRAVARACATNPVAIVIPCHRAVRANGDLGGYRWGLTRKQALLDRETHPDDSAS